MSKKNTNNSTKWLFEEVLTVFRKEGGKPLNYKQVAKALNIEDAAARNKVIDVLHALHSQGSIEEEGHGKYRLKQKGLHIVGKVDMTSSGNAYIVSDQSEEDIFVTSNRLKSALHGDTVKVYCLARKEGQKPEGEVVEIISRGKSEFTGIIQVSKNFAFLVPDSNKMPGDIFIPLEGLNGAKNGEKVIVKITDFPPGAKNPVGEVVRVLGAPGENEVEMNAIMADYGLPMVFPDEVEKAAEKIDFDIPESEIKKRWDFRDVLTFTIDPVDAKDFDDALSIKKLDNGHWQIGVHIADVSHYVTPDSILDKEAYSRATSVYLVDRCVPMLPEKLSNGVCSLRPNETKLTFSAVFEMNENAEIIQEWFGRTAIHSNRRFTYEEAQKIIEEEKGELAQELLTFDRLAKIMRKERMKKGAIAFDKIEVKFHLDKAGKPTGVYFKESKDSNKLIEEFMLLANRRVAEFVGKGRVGKKQGAIRPFVYRVHDLPDPDKLISFSDFIGKLGYKKINTGSPTGIAKSINSLLKEVKGKGEENIVEQLAIRSMAKAEYTTENIGHYGLAFSHYSHFTSPIRRYPDVMVHRLLAQYLAETAGTQKSQKVNQNELEEQCKHSSDMERLASQAERDSIKYKQVEYMAQSLGKVFDGTITGVTEWGIYVEINENKCEGMVRLRDMEDDFYIFDEKNYCVRGRRLGKKMQLGDQVKILVKRADLVKKQMDFALVSKDYAATTSTPANGVINDLDFSDVQPSAERKEPRGQFSDNPNENRKSSFGGAKSNSRGGKGAPRGGKGGPRGGSRGGKKRR